MRCTALLFAIAIGIWPAVTACQSPSANPLPAQLRAHLNDGRFDVVTSVRGLPLGVRDELQTMFGGTLDIADPDGAIRGTEGVVDSTLPTRRLVTAACSTNHYCIVHYQRGGLDPTWHIAVFHWTPAETRFEWGGATPGGVRSVAELRTLALSGSINASSSW